MTHTNLKPICTFAPAIPVATAIQLILERLPLSIEYGDPIEAAGTPDYYPGIRGGLSGAIAGYAGSPLWRRAIAATAFRG